MKALCFGVAGAAFALTLACSSVDDTGNKGFNTGGSATTTGGSATTTGGNPGTAGTTTTTAGTEAGGMTAGGSGGSTPAGGSTAGGSDGAGGSSAGAGGMSTMPGGPDAVLKSSGCGKPLPANQVKTIAGSRTGYTEYHVKQTGATIGTDEAGKAVDRQFFVRVPVDYDPNKAYRVVYIYQGCSANANEGNTATYPLFNEGQGGTEQAVYVAVSLPPNHPNNNCYDNRAGTQSQEWEAFQMFHDKVEANYCVDNNRIFVSGYSSGGWVSNMFSCYFGGSDPTRKFLSKYALRGRAATSGGLITNNMPKCEGPVAALYLHDAGDTTNVIAGSQTGLDNTLMQNKCTGSQTKGWAGGDMNICKQYTDCPKEYPVVFCTTNGQGHNDQSNRAIPWFKNFFDMMNAP